MSGAVDFTAGVVAHLASDEAITVPVYGNTVPERTAVPYVLVTTILSLAAAPPTSEWWDAAVEVDCLDTTHVASFELAAAVQESLQGLIGTSEFFVATAVSQGDIRFVDDAGFVPAASRHIVSVDITARKQTA